MGMLAGFPCAEVSSLIPIIITLVLPSRKGIMKQVPWRPCRILSPVSREHVAPLRGEHRYYGATCRGAVALQRKPRHRAAKSHRYIRITSPPTG